MGRDRIVMTVPMGSYPTRAPVHWKRVDSGQEERTVVIVIEKQFSGLESIIAKLLRAPVQLRRPLDIMNSTLWELMDGKHSFEEITSEMDILYNESIAPSVERCGASIEKFVELNLAVIRTSPINGEWDVSSS